MHPKNRTRYKTLDKAAADSRVVEIWSEEEDGHGLWLKLADGWRWQGYGGSLIHRCTAREILEELKYNVEQGEPY